MAGSLSVSRLAISGKRSLVKLWRIGLSKQIRTACAEESKIGERASA